MRLLSSLQLPPPAVFPPLVLGGLVAAGCSLGTEPEGRQPESVASLSLPLDVEVADGLRLSCGPGAPRDSAFHWVDSRSFVRLESTGRTELGILVEDLPPTRAGSFRCGGEGHEEGIRRPGTYTIADEGVVRFIWAGVAEPDTAGVWVTSEEAWLGQGIPVTESEFSAVLEYKGRTAVAVLSFPVTGGP